ncbi:MAG: 1-deoxy-D-xylulose-5-phosphate reductoisomerase [Clostridia bacterium]|nr:1-deoxy-D-xylulose-5-phosphate reductoisomerase [Clostridia bacterium]
MRRVSVLGSTGSVGTQSLDVIEKLGMPAAALTAGSNDRLMERQARAFHPQMVVMADVQAAQRLKIALGDTDIQVYHGEEALCEAACAGDIALTALVGIAGLRPTMAALEEGRDIALANKETLVCAGELVMAKAAEKGVKILPVDSEHSAIFQCLEGRRHQLERILLTCSGGAFYGKKPEEVASLTAKEALAHPTWKMGAKITVDCASLMNKGLELIEAMRLYDTAPEQIEILIHRQSIVHSAVEFTDGSVIAQLGVPDMRLPIQYALTWPERVKSPVPRLDLTASAALTFAHPDYDSFPCLGLARRAARVGGTACAVLNGANEAAVAHFLAGDIRFGQIAEAVSYAMDTIPAQAVTNLDDVFAADREARAAVERLF